jgi:hypothetical protein
MKLRKRAIATGLLALLLIPACVGPGPESRAPRWGLLEEYVDPAGQSGAHTLALYKDGDFQLRHCPREPCDPQSPSEVVAEGKWERSEGILVLSTDDWEAMFVSAIVPVELLGRSDTLRGFQWMQSSTETPIDTCRFVLREDFRNFVHPPDEGSSASGL